ncbi:tyrosine-protein phosphatase [Glycomyces sp. TRM65418]|uniref:tyrosine-protein phosphatase n=1 Tax=Glycomyces sp. TRM65418 TaxID=2867006 RepID=UPI001CE65BDF|nr:tyrosine-protein phosphatase [Glycomyces sp. TRM65418]MCC3765220.1 tyrosine-protein phosphatase [Glycomyces sp. TRM65418]QZD54845.1 tyrosine-protein phosphatase [Glycomyces sp. TRM65418]
MLVNLRDPAQRLRAGLLYRSAQPGRLAPGQIGEIAAGLGLRDIIDLRTEAEARRVPWTGLPETVRVHRLALGGEVVDPEPLRRIRTGEDLGRWYAALAVNAADGLIRIVRMVAAEGPTLVHCAAGKDRTGVAVAAVLELLGCDPEAIVEDYGRTDAAMQEIVRVVAAGGDPHDHLLNRLPPVLGRAPAEAMRTCLTELARDHGGFLGLLTDRGLTEADLDALRRRFTTEAPLGA